MNRYSYVSNNPLNYIDPTGHKSFWKQVLGVAEMAVGAVLVAAGEGSPISYAGAALMTDGARRFGANVDVSMQVETYSWGGPSSVAEVNTSSMDVNITNMTISQENKQYARVYASEDGRVNVGFELCLDCDAIVSDSKVRSAMDQAWIDSNPGTDSAREQGGWIISINEGYDVMRWPSGKQAMILPTSMPENAAASFHTHPNIGPKWNPNPSPPDIRITQQWGVPGYVINAYGIVRIDPKTGRFLYVHIR